MNEQNTVLLVGGGTGGHVFPMIAVADALVSLAPDLRVVFVGTSRGLEAKLVPERGYPLELIDALPLRGVGVLGAAKGALRAASNVVEARSLVNKYKPKVVFSLGGYAAGAVALAARLHGIPVALMEPNSVIGLANRLIAPFVKRAYTAFDETAAYFSEQVVLRSGVAIRGGFDPQRYAPSREGLKVLVLGGSQGAKAINELMPAAVSQMQYKVSLVHQAGRERSADLAAAYAAQAPRTKVEVVEFIDDMPAAIAAADLVISRSGAGAVSEICAVGRPSILIPYPYAAGDHQLKNASSLERAGASRVIPASEATSERVASVVDQLATERERLLSMAEAARQWGRPYAADFVARDLLKLAGLASAFATPSATQAKPRTDGSPSLFVPVSDSVRTWSARARLVNL